MTDVVRNIIESVREQLIRHRNRPFLEASMAVCAYIANADNEISFSERSRIDILLETLDELKIYDPHEAVDEFNRVVEDLRAHPRDGRDRVMRTLEEFKDEPEQAKLLIRIGIAIAQADGVYDNNERRRIGELCQHVGIDAHAIETSVG